jgi:hypothetical protein
MGVCIRTNSRPPASLSHTAPGIAAIPGASTVAVPSAARVPVKAGSAKAPARNSSRLILALPG